MVWDLVGALDAELLLVDFKYLANLVSKELEELALGGVINDGTN